MMVKESEASSSSCVGNKSFLLSGPRNWRSEGREKDSSHSHVPITSLFLSLPSSCCSILSLFLLSLSLSLTFSPSSLSQLSLSIPLHRIASSCCIGEEGEGERVTSIAVICSFRLSHFLLSLLVFVSSPASLLLLSPSRLLSRFSSHVTNHQNA